MTTIVRAVIEAVCNGVFWGVVLTAMVAWLIWLVGRTNAGTRFAVWCFTLAALVLLPVLMLRSHLPEAVPGPEPPPDLSIFPALWSGGALLMLARLAWSALHVRRLRRRATPLRPEGMPICSSAGIASPMAVGVISPVVLIPEDLLPHISAAEREHIILHELAHIRRLDHWTNLAQKLAEALLFFHPAVWWIGRRLRTEREIACDDWVVAAGGRAQPYAATLARLLELTAFRRGPVLATAAAGNRSQIARRIEMLLDGTRNRSPQPAFAALCAAAFFLLAGVVWCAQQPALFAFSGAPSESGRQTRISHSNFWGSFTLKASGNIEFTDNDRDVKNLSPGGSLTLEERQGLSWRKLSFTARSGGVERAFSLNGIAQPFEPEGRKWAIEMLPRVIRETGIGAPGRVARILRQGGPQAVLAEIARIESDRSKRIYCEELIARTSDPDLFRRVVAQGTHEIDSDGERRILLSHLLHRAAARGPLLAELMLSAARLHSDGEKATFLIEAARSYAEDASTRAAFFKVVRTINSDGERRRVLAALLKRPLAKQDLARVFEAAAKLDSDGEKAWLLVQGAGEIPPDAAVRRAWFGAVETIHSDGEHRRALLALLQDNGRDRDTLVAIIRSAGRISSDGEKATILARVANECPDDDAVLSTLVDAAQTLHSDGEYRRVITPLVRRGHTIHIIKKI
jgi:bla regulator protein blaR1